MKMDIDWSIFEGEPENTCYCRCEKIYRSHTKVHLHGEKLYTVTMKDCPGCGKSINNCYRIQSDPETYSIG